MLYLYYLELRLLFQTWFHLKTPFSKTPLLLSHWNKIAIRWRYQYSSTWNGKIWWLLFWMNFVQVDMVPKKHKTGIWASYTGCGTCFKIKTHLRFVDFPKILPIWIFAKNKYFLMNIKKKKTFFPNICLFHWLWDVLLGWEVDTQAGTPNNLEICSVSAGHKILEFPPKKCPCNI